jgi:hypothetical protein
MYVLARSIESCPNFTGAGFCKRVASQLRDLPQPHACGPVAAWSQCNLRFDRLTRCRMVVLDRHMATRYLQSVYSDCTSCYEARAAQPRCSACFGEVQEYHASNKCQLRLARCCSVVEHKAAGMVSLAVPTSGQRRSSWILHTNRQCSVTAWYDVGRAAVYRMHF